MNSTFKFFLRFLFLALTVLVSFGATNSVTGATPLTPPSMGATVLRMIGALLLVLTLFFAAAWLFRNGHKFKSSRGVERKLQVLEAKSLGPRQAVYVIGYEQQRLLIGATQQGLTLLTHLPDGQQAPEPAAAPSLIQVSFGEALMQALGRK